MTLQILSKYNKKLACIRCLSFGLDLGGTGDNQILIKMGTQEISKDWSGGRDRGFSGLMFIIIIFGEVTIMYLP